MEKWKIVLEVSAPFYSKVHSAPFIGGLIYLEKSAEGLLQEVKLFHEAGYLYQSLAEINPVRDRVLTRIFELTTNESQMRYVYAWMKPGTAHWKRFLEFLGQSDIPGAREISVDLMAFDELHKKVIPRLELAA